MTEAKDAPETAPPAALEAAAPSSGKPELGLPLTKRMVLSLLALAGAVVLTALYLSTSKPGESKMPPPLASALLGTATAGQQTGSSSSEAAAAPKMAMARAEELLTAATTTSAPTDARLLRIYGLIATSQARQALDEAAQLAADFPNFGLAQLVYADLLNTHSSPTEGFGAVNMPLRSEATERLRELVAEARARVGGVSQRPPLGTVPAQFVRLDPSVRHAVAVDVSKSRLYLLENTPAGPVVIRDYYSSVGKLGMAKQVEGDLRTPLGVYFVTGRIADARLRDPSLDDRYGAAALALNYPNQYDQMKGRTGSGIWLHGVSTALFSRAPLATDGCVALTNPDLLEVTRYIERQETPVLIVEQIDWVAPASALQRQAGFMRTFDAWKQARSQADTAAALKFYATDLNRKRGNSSAGMSTGAAAIDGVSVLTWKDDRDIVVVTFTESATGSARPRLKRQYWLEQSGKWQVVFEGSLG